MEIECPTPGTHSYLHADHHSRYYNTTLGAATLVYSSGEGGRVALGGPLRSPCRRRNGRVGPRYYDTTLGAATLVYSSGERGGVGLGGPSRCEASPKALAMPLVMGLAAG